MNASTTPLPVVGPSNPGSKYELTHHNVGRLVLDELTNCTSPIPSSFSVHEKSNAEIMQTRFKIPDSGERQVILAKPRTYINLSGGPIAALVKFFSIAPTDIIVVHDELDLDSGMVCLKRGEGENDYSGLRSTSKSLGMKDYMWMRASIDCPPDRQDPADYVLRSFNVKEREELAFTLLITAEAVRLIVSRRLEIMQNQVHGR